jgi:hypothetical protein
MRLGWAVLVCMVLASGAHSAPTAGAACPPNVENRVQGIFLPNGISRRAKAKLLAQAKAQNTARLKSCLKARGSVNQSFPGPSLKPK